jgi:hypothetical protein
MKEFRNKHFLYERERHAFYLTPLSVAKVVGDRNTEHGMLLTGEKAQYSEVNLPLWHFVHHKFFKD